MAVYYSMVTKRKMQRFIFSDADGEKKAIKGLFDGIEKQKEDRIGDVLSK